MFALAWSLATVSPTPYWSAVGIAAAGCALACTAARRSRGAWRDAVAWALGALLLGDVVAYSVGLALAGTWSAKTSLPFALCDVAVLVAAAAAFTRIPFLVELTWFWGLAGTLQGVLTPDLSVGFPHLVFFEYVVGHLGIVVTALYLVVGLRHAPRPRAALRVYGVTALYTAFVGLVDALTGADYMFLRRPPAEWTLLRVLGPWPWYILSAAGVAVVLLTLLDMPFWPARRRAASSPRVPEPAAR